MLIKFKCLCLVFIVALCSPVIAQQKINVNVFVYHLKPPFIVSHTKKLGLYFDFSNYLNTKSDNYHFETIFVPRKRIETMIASGKLDGILLGVNPVWFDDKAETKYLWTGNFYHDRDEIVSLAEEAFEYTTPISLAGKILGGVRGFYYFGIDELVDKGEITRYDTIGEYELLQMIQLKRVDVGIISRSTLQYLSKAKNWQNKFYQSQKPHDKYQRRVLIPKSNKAIYDEVSALIDNLDHDCAWQDILKKYN